MSRPIASFAQRLQGWFSPFPDVIVAYSGGVDSAVVAKAACLALGRRAKAITACSPSLAQSEKELAVDIAAQIGIEHQLVSTNELSKLGYTQNGFDRCYFCKSTLYETIQYVEPNCPLIVNGANADDLGDHRPGMKAAQEFQVRSPLIELSFNKQTVRELARFYQLPVWNKPASPCLSSRIAYGIEVTTERLGKIEQAEAFLKTILGIDELRVRVHENDLARIELPKQHLGDLLCEAAQRDFIVQKLLSLGFTTVTIDLEGFQSGKLNRSIPSEQLVQLLPGK